MKIELIRKLTIAELFGLFSDPLGNGLWARMGIRLEAMKEALFQNQGGLYGRKSFVGIAESLNGKPRKGTDGNVYGNYYSGMTDILKASGTYLQSFQNVEEHTFSMVWGSTHELGDKIPYAGWNRKEPGWEPRYVMPDQEDSQLETELLDEGQLWVDEMIARAEQMAVEQVEQL